MTRRIALISATVVALVATTAVARLADTQPDEFLAEVFDGEPPKAAMLWITGALKDQTEAVLEHAAPAIRTRYWARGERTAWILEEIGKEQPITTGIVVGPDGVEQLRILIYRESRGWEVQLASFRKQFVGAQLTDAQRLDQRIDGISGATLSVTAMDKLARLALLYHAKVQG